MSLPSTLAISISNVLFRSSLNVIDRFLLSKNFLEFFQLLFITSLIPLIFGCILLLFLGELSNLIIPFMTWQCFLLSLSNHLAGLSFSSALSEQPIKQVALRAKLPELFLPLLLLLPGYSDSALNIKTWMPLFITWIAVIPMFRRIEVFSFICDKSTFWIGSTLLLQMVASAFFFNEFQCFTEVLVFTIASILWRTIFGMIMCLKHGSSKINTNETMTLLNFTGLIFSRSFCALVTQVTFMWCVLQGQPLIYWPIINMTPLISSAASHFLLKEKIEFAEGFALTGFCVAATLPLLM